MPDGEATPVDFGDVCVNDDTDVVRRARPRPTGRPRGARRPGLRRPARRGEPGHVVARAGVPAGDDRRLRRRRLGRTTGHVSRDNGVEVVDGWTEAYYERFTGGGDGAQPLVVSYGTSPPAEVVFADPPIDAADHGRHRRPRASARSSSPACCAGTEHPTRPTSSSTSCCSPTFQTELPLNLFVYPANNNVRAARGLHRQRHAPRRPGDARPGHDRRPPRDVDRRVDRHRPALNGRHRLDRAWPASRRRRRCRSFLLVFYVWPFVTLLARGLSRRTPSATRSGARSRGDIVWFTLWQAVASTVLTIVVGLAPAYVVARYRFPGRRLLTALLTAAFVLPTVVMGAAVLALLPPGSSAVCRRSCWPTWSSTSPSSCARSAPCGITCRPTSRPRRRRSAPRRGGRSGRSRCRCCVRRSWPPARSCSCSRSRRSASSASSATPARRRSRSRSGVRRRSSAISAPRPRSPCSSWSPSGPGSPGRRGSSVVTGGPSTFDAQARRRRARSGRGSAPLVAVVGTLDSGRRGRRPLVALVERSLRGSDGYSLGGWRSLGRTEVRPGIDLGIDPLDVARRVAAHDGRRHGDRRRRRRARRARHHRRRPGRAAARHRADAARSPRRRSRSASVC